MKSSGVGLAEHTACMGQKRNTYRDLVRKPQGENNLGDVEIDGRIVLSLKKEVEWEDADLVCLRKGKVVGRLL